MKHALIIDDNMVVASALQDRLRRIGFTSFHHAWSERDALAAAKRQAPDLILVGDTIEEGSAVNAARRINAQHDAPILLVTGDSLKAKSSLPEGASLGRPFLLRELDSAVEVARCEARKVVAQATQI
jgi:DNA-binding response OmpR family regulator